MKDNPPMILQFARFLAAGLRDAYPDARIHARAMMSLNSRAPQLLIDPTADLARQPDSLLAADWILPLAQRPFPHPTTPALLLSRRYAGALLLLNVTEQPYPLDGLVIHAGEQRFTGADFGASALLAGECLLIHSADADLTTIFAPCNQSGSPLVLGRGALDAAIRIESGTRSEVCDGVVCIITDEQP